MLSPPNKRDDTSPTPPSVDCSHSFLVHLNSSPSICWDTAHTVKQEKRVAALLLLAFRENKEINLKVKPHSSLHFNSCLQNKRGKWKVFRLGVIKQKCSILYKQIVTKKWNNRWKKKKRLRKNKVQMDFSAAKSKFIDWLLQSQINKCNKTWQWFYTLPTFCIWYEMFRSKQVKIMLISSTESIYFVNGKW